MKNSFIKVTSFILTVIMLLGTITSCAKPEENKDDTNEEITYPTVDDLSLKDSETVYAEDDDTSVVVMYLTVSKGSSTDNTDHTWKDVNDHSTYYYDELGVDKYAVKGMLQIGDENGPTPDSYGFSDVSPNCTVTIRGKTSTRSPQKSYKISIPSIKPSWRGQRTINLNKHVYDSLRFRNKMCYDLLRDIPDAFSVRTQFVHLYVKDLTEGASASSAEFVDYGLFTQAEQINKSYLRNHNLDENGHLYKANMFEFLRYDGVIVPTTDPEYDRKAFEDVLEIKGAEDHEKLVQMLEDVNNYNIPIEEVVANHFDDDNYFTWLAFMILVGNTDTTSQNFFLYSPLNGNKWYFIPWDNDGSFRYEEDIIYREYSGQYNYTSGVGNYWGAVLHQRVLKSPELREKLTDKVEELKAYLTKDRISDLVNKYEEIVYPYISRVPDMLYLPRKLDQHKQIVSLVADEIDYQYELYKESLKHPMPYFLSLPETVNGQWRFGWDSSYDFNNEKITYTFELAKDADFTQIINRQENIVVPQITTDVYEAGQYFFRVTATNESGMTQSAMEMYQDADGKKFFGVATFYVDTDGAIYGEQ